MQTCSSLLKTFTFEIFQFYISPIRIFPTLNFLHIEYNNKIQTRIFHAPYITIFNCFFLSPSYLRSNYYLHDLEANISKPKMKTNNLLGQIYPAVIPAILPIQSNKSVNGNKVCNNYLVTIWTLFFLYLFLFKEVIRCSSLRRRIFQNEHELRNVARIFIRLLPTKAYI